MRDFVAVAYEIRGRAANDCSFFKFAITGVPPAKMVETYRRMASVRARVFRYDTEG